MDLIIINCITSKDSINLHCTILVIVGVVAVVLDTLIFQLTFCCCEYSITLKKKIK